MKQITTDNFSFERLRKDNTLYVDKTQYVWNLVNSKTFIYFLSRPRRFGKSLLLSTLKAFFQGKKELFHDLAIERLAPADAWQQWPVIHLDMAQASSRTSMEEAQKALKNYISDAAHNAGIKVKGDELPQDLFRRMILELYEKTGKQVVVLIDEYDKPILDALHKPYVDDMVSIMQGFYQTVKSNVDKERFVFITGVTKFAHTSLFSGFNNPTDITQDADFATMLGYTEKELRDNFAEYLDVTSQEMGTEKEALIEKMRQWYDGFRFTTDAAHVFNPVSVGKFFRYKEFGNYWFETGTPTFLVEEVHNNPFTLDEYTHEWVEPQSFSKIDVTTLDSFALAVQTGYLSIAEVKRDLLGTSIRYDFPNKEVRLSWNKEMVKHATSGNVNVDRQRRKFLTPVSQGDVDGTMRLLQAMFAGVTKENVGDVHEGYYRNMMYMLFTAFGVSVHAEEQVGRGRVDIVVEAYGHAYVFELKVSNNGKEADIKKLLDEGVDQASMKHYAEKYQLQADVTHVIAVVFENKNKQLVAWREGKVGA